MDKGTLRSQIEGPLNKGEENLILRDFANFSGWKWGNLSFAFPKPLALEMKATPLPFSNHGEDRLSWHSSPNGDFNLKEAYRLANKGDTKMLFPAMLSPKHLDLSHSSSKRYGYPFLCPMCNNELETILHALRNCPKEQSFLNSLSSPLQSNLFYGLQLVDWLNLNCKTSMASHSSNISWNLIFPFAVWTFWLFQNCLAFENPT